MSFSLEDRDAIGRKKSAFYSVTACKSDNESEGSYTTEEIRVVRCLLSKHVVAATYDDAIRRRIMSNTPELRTEVTSILGSYDQRIAEMLEAK